MEIITKKTISVEFEDKKYVLPDEVTIGVFLVQLGLSEDTPVKITVTKEGFCTCTSSQKWIMDSLLLIFYDSYKVEIIGKD